MACLSSPAPGTLTDTLLAIIKANILPGITIMSDCWRAYRCLPDHGYFHATVNHSENFADPVTGAHTQNIERLWREVRANVPRFGRGRELYSSYIAEFLWKRQVRHINRIHEFFASMIDVYYTPGTEANDDEGDSGDED